MIFSILSFWLSTVLQIPLLESILLKTIGFKARLSQCLRKAPYTPAVFDTSETDSNKHANR